MILKVVDKEVAPLQAMLEEKKVTSAAPRRRRATGSPRRATTRSSARARMARLVDNALKKPLAEALLFGSLKNGGKAFADVKADGSGLSLHATPALTAVKSA